LEFRGSVQVVGSVSEARDYLEGHGKFADRGYYPCPDLIVSDMNLPGETGNSFLEYCRGHGTYQHVPFAFLSGTFLPVDKARADALGSNQFFAKTGDIKTLRERIGNILKMLPAAEKSSPTR
jgi:CheY-like chemotaxis protein